MIIKGFFSRGLANPMAAPCSSGPSTLAGPTARPSAPPPRPPPLDLEARRGGLVCPRPKVPPERYSTHVFFYFQPQNWEMIQINEHIFRMG